MSKYKMPFFLEGNLEWDGDTPQDAVRGGAGYLNDRLQTIKRRYRSKGYDFVWDLVVPRQAAEPVEDSPEE